MHGFTAQSMQATMPVRTRMRIARIIVCPTAQNATLMV